jgi:arylsulfatase A-like enzyme
MAALADLGLKDKTLVVYTTDHGEMLGHHGMYLKGPWPYEDLLRVGLIVAGPGVRQGCVIGQPVSTLDLAPTFYDYAGTPAPVALQGATLKPMLEGKGETRAAAYSEWHVHPSRCGVALKLRTVRTRRHKLTLELESGAGELYDLAEDPDEMNSVFDDAAYRRIRRELEETIRARPGKVRSDLPPPIGMA